VLAGTTVRMHGAVADRFVDDDVPVADLDVVEAGGIGTDPGLELYGCALTAKVRERNEITCTALAASRKHEFHAHLPFHQLQATAASPEWFRLAGCHHSREVLATGASTMFSAAFSKRGYCRSHYTTLQLFSPTGTVPSNPVKRPVASPSEYVPNVAGSS
jgi:hypothetical protein